MFRYVMPMADSRRPVTLLSYALVLFVVLSGLCLCLLCLVEHVLEKDHANKWAELSKQFKPYYWWHFVTHDGRDLGYEHKGPLQLALHPFAIYSNLPNQRSDYFSTDDHGFRGNGRDRPLDTHGRVVLIGGSTAFGTGLESDSETVASKLAKLLNAEVINAAVIGHGSGQELTYLLTDLVDTHPDLVIALDGWNDYYKRLEVGDPVEVLVGGAALDVAGPGDDVDLALALAELLHHLLGVGERVGGERGHRGCGHQGETETVHGRASSWVDGGGTICEPGPKGELQ